MAIVVKLNDVTIDHKDGLVYVDNLNETLDSGVVICEAIDKLNINPMDALEIKLHDNSRHKFLVSEYVEEVASYNPPKYNYQIQYVSPVLKFERITLPNIAITKVFKPTENENYLIREGDYYVRSVGYYIRQYINEYYEDDDILIFDSDMVKADSTICPEMAFNRPTLREVLQALFEVIDEIFTLSYEHTQRKYAVYGISPNQKNRAIDVTKLNTDTIRNSVNTYASNLDIELKNAISTKTTSSTQILTVRSEEGILTTDNAKLILSNPIYAIKSVQVNITAIPTSEDASWTESSRPSSLSWIDITRHVVEQSVYEGLQSKSATWGENIDKPELTKYNTLYFKQGSNTIEGLAKTHKYLGILSSDPVIKDVLWYALGSDMTLSIGVALSKFVENHFFNMMFRITYETMQDVRILTERSNQLPHKSILFDNQESSYVNVENFTKNSVSKLNRLSNNERNITAIYTNASDVPVLGDYIDDYILTNREISIYDNYIAFNGILTKDYSNIYQFNAIDSKKRFYQIATQDSLIRNEVIKYYVSYSYNNDSLEDFDDLITKFLKQSYLMPKYALINYAYKNDDGNNYMRTYYIATEVTPYVVEDGVIFSFGFNDNIVAGSYVGNQKTGGYYQQPLKYVDNYGENLYVMVDFYSSSHAVSFDNGADYQEFWEDYAKKYPKIAEDDVNVFFSLPAFSIKSEHHKDQREIQKWTLQIQTYSEEPNIIFGKYMLDNNVFLKIGYTADFEDFVVYKANYTFDKNNVDEIDYDNAEKVTEEIDEESVDVHPEITDNYFKINARGNIAVVTASGKIVLAINNHSRTQRIYCNVRKSR